ncbi:MAG TPA: C-type lectin domain-containing protein [Kofleriaceae bacterium]|jgi:hypothetical protein
MRLFCLSLLLSCAVACGGNGDDGVDHIPDAGAATDVLTKTSPEAAGSNCQYGGTEVQVGIDKNGNGMLDADEVQSTFYVCDQAPPPNPLVYYGELIIGSSDDVAAAQMYTGVVGDVIVENDSDVAALDVALPNLAFISGEITDCTEFNEGGTAFHRAHKPAALPNAITLDFAALQTVGDIDIDCSGSVTTLAFPALTAIHGGVFLENSSIATWTAPMLTSVEQSIGIYDTSLTSLVLPPPGGTPDATLNIQGNLDLDDCAMDDLAGAIRRAGFRGTITVNSNGAGSGSGSGDGSDTTCTDATHVCQAVNINNDSTDWRECSQQVDFADARAMCQAIGTGWDLAYFTSITEEQSVGALQYNPTFWIGYYQAVASAPYTWVQTSDATFAPQSSMDPTSGAFWNAGEPTGDANPDCVQIFSLDQADPTAVVANDVTCDENFYQPLCRYLP